MLCVFVHQINIRITYIGEKIRHYLKLPVSYAYTSAYIKYISLNTEIKKKLSRLGICYK